MATIDTWCRSGLAWMWMCAAAAPVATAQTESRQGMLSSGGAREEVHRVVEGFVYGPEGSAAEGAVVVTSAGGRAVTDSRGGYRIEVMVPPAMESLQVTAVGASGRNLVASASVGLARSSPRTSVPPLLLTQTSTCSPSWLPTFGGEGTDGNVFALTVFDDGSGPALYLGGDFTIAGGVAANHVAKWDGNEWSAVGSGTNDSVRELAVYDDGSGPALYAGGRFTTAGGLPANYVAKWNGSSWSALGSGTNDWVRFFAVYDDGDGPGLYVGGAFTIGGGTVAHHVARWDGSSWKALGSGVNGDVFALTVYDDGGGLALYVGGDFTTAGGAAADYVAKWDGSSWSALGSGMNTGVLVLATYDSGSGTALYAGGSFTTAGGVGASHIAKWDGSSWSALGSGTNNDVECLAVHDDGGGPVLFAGGIFNSAGGHSVESIAKWNGASWAATEGVTDDVQALAIFDDGSGAVLYAGGRFTESSIGGFVHYVARLESQRWIGVAKGLNEGVQDMTVHDDGSGPALYAIGAFTRAGDVNVDGMAKWDGSSWASVGDAPGILCSTLAVYDDGNGPELYAGGGFTTFAGVPAKRIAKWDGSNWSALSGGGLNGQANRLGVYDDGSGPALYAGGNFTTAGGAPANRIARWNGSSWSALGSGTNNQVTALTVYDDGGGPALYAGGYFTTAGGVPANKIAKWDGSTWSPLGSGMNGFTIDALGVYDDGNGPALYAGGDFTIAGGVTVNRIAKWDGSSWSALGSGANGFFVTALTVYDDGTGPALYAGGDFTIVGGVTANRIAKWDGSSWSPLGSGMFAAFLSGVGSLVVYDDGGGPDLYAGGNFSRAIDSGDAFLARWGCLDTVAPILTCPPTILAPERLGSPPGELVYFTATAIDGIDPAPTVVCVPPSGSFFPPGTTPVTCTATDASGNQSTCQFSVTVASKVRRR